ncbi:MAG: nitrile hydratase subunit beta [Deltaproteobacteria bacterium]|nr:MAG: nitrile hydratase subunit beta [Deltaproteobacteria bacterium]
MAPDEPDDVDLRLTALTNLLVAKGVLTEAELAEAVRKLKP